MKNVKLGVAEYPFIIYEGGKYYYPVWTSDEKDFYKNLIMISPYFWEILPFKTRKGICGIAPYNLTSNFNEIKKILNVEKIDKEWLTFFLKNNEGSHLRISGKYNENLVELPFLIGNKFPIIDGLSKEEILNLGAFIKCRWRNFGGLIKNINLLKE